LVISLGAVVLLLPSSAWAAGGVPLRGSAQSLLSAGSSSVLLVDPTPTLDPGPSPLPDPSQEPEPGSSGSSTGSDPTPEPESSPLSPSPSSEPLSESPASSSTTALAVEDGTPVLVQLDQPTWDLLVGLLAACGFLTALVGALLVVQVGRGG
jgi:hypothetical protein